MPTSEFTETTKARFEALLDALVGRGWLGPSPAPLANVDPQPPAGVRLGWASHATNHQKAAVTNFVNGWDWSAPAATAARREAAALAALTDDTPLGVVVRAFVRDLYTQLGDLYELMGRPRPDPREAVIRVSNAIKTGTGDPDA